ncbi:hypothetical protein TRICI_006747 [Trichomonascus ciferrii]|uniref:separase n=1 Tax=Trichomonascus ciferrii TaxID=44093 RepID=A0A642UE46_9ASCO|nr:hypothetical protein TRICI_006747 [Trichomonascus ciferrii]
MRDALLQDFENLSLERLSRIKRTLQPAESTTAAGKTRLRSKPLGVRSNAARNNSASTKDSETRLDLSRRVIDVSFKTLDGLKNGGNSDGLGKGQKSKKHVYEACAAAIDSLYDIKRIENDKLADYEAGKLHVSFILKLLDLMMALNCESGNPLVWCRFYPEPICDQKTSLIGRLVLSLSNSASVQTSCHMRATALSVLPVVEPRFLDQLLTCVESVISRKVLSPEETVREYGEEILRISLKHPSVCQGAESYQKLLSKFQTIAMESDDESLMQSWRSSDEEIKQTTKRHEQAGSLADELRPDIAKEELNTLLTSNDLMAAVDTPAFNKALFRICEKSLHNAQLENVSSILQSVFLPHLEEIKNSQSCAKLLELFLAYTKNKACEINEAICNNVYDIYSDFVTIFSHFVIGDALLHISNSLLNFGERVRTNGIDDFIRFWELSLHLELEFSSLFAPKSYLITKAERLALGFLGRNEPQDAISVIGRSLQIIFDRKKMSKVVATKPVTIIPDMESVYRLVSIASRALLDDLDLPCAFDNLNGELECVLLEMMLQTLSKTSNERRIELATKILERAKQLLPSREYPIRTLRLGIGFHNATGQIENGMASILEEVSKNHIGRSKFGSDEGLAYTAPIIRALTLYTLAINKSYPEKELFTYLEKAVEGFVTSLNSEFEAMENIESFFVSLNRFSAFLELQGAHELRVKLLKSMITSSPESSTALYHTQLASSYLCLGYTGASVKELRLAKKLEKESGYDEMTQGAIMVLEADCHIANENADLAKQSINELNSFIQTSEHLREPVYNGRNSGESLDHFQRRVILFSQAALSFAKLSNLEGNTDVGAVNSQKVVRLLQGLLKKYSTGNYAGRVSNTWSLVSVLIEALVLAAKTFESMGVVREASYYIQEASKLAESSNCSLRQATILSLEGEINVRMNKLEYAQDVLQKCEGLMEDINFKDVNFLQLVHSLALYLQRQCLYSEENVYYDVSEEVFSELIARAEASDEPMNELTADLKKLKVDTRAAVARRKAAADRKQNVKDATSSTKGLETVHNNLLRSQAYSLGLQDAVDGAIEILESKSRKYLSDETREGVLFSASRARNSFLKAKKLLMMDPVFGVLQDSALSVPSADLSTVKRSTRGTTSTSKSASSSYSEAVTWLIDAREHIVKNKSKIITVCSSIEIAEVSNLLSNITVLLHAVCRAQEVLVSDLSFSFYEVSKGYTSQLNRRALEMKPSSSYDWPQIQDVANNPLPESALNFEEESLNKIPKNWLVVSINVCRDSGNLMISRFEHGRSPFMLSLPLNRHSSRDADENSFSFDDGLHILNEIIKKSNASCHSSRTSKINTKEKRKQWWEERHELDKELESLLHDVEYCWLGGFRGIFDSRVVGDDEFEKFKQSFNNILNNHLPSRRAKQNGKNKPVGSLGGKATKSSPKVDIHPRVFELLLSVGHPDTLSDPGLLEDLIYFILDILQFHGEQNAYDEIDMDQVVVEVEECLQVYHSKDPSGKTYDHTVLVLDKKCQNFPWESIPLLRNKSVTRIASLNMLKDLLTRTKSFEIPSDDFYYILNPGRDLIKTQERFEQPFSEINWWKGKVGEAPTEEEIASTLTSRNAFVYVGHGGGEQYIRSSKIKGLEKCCPTMLLGCSSGALEQAGDYDPWGTPVSYMIAGCPMLVANMWDVTDKDIDKFSMSVFKKWGVFDEDCTGETMAKCVSESRAECTLKYLNGAAPVVYGLPLCLSDRRKNNI